MFRANAVHTVSPYFVDVPAGANANPNVNPRLLIVSNSSFYYYPVPGFVLVQFTNVTFLGLPYSI
jgi:hypothetical protein